MSQIVTQNQTKCQYQSEKIALRIENPLYAEQRMDYVG